MFGLVKNGLYVNSSSLTLVSNLFIIQYKINYLVAFVSLLHQAKGGSRKILCTSPLVRENIDSTTGQELESIHYTKATEKVTAAKNVGKILFREKGEGGGAKNPPSL